MSARENGRAATEVTTPPVVPVERASALPSTCLQDNTLALVREADENATDGELDVWMSYRVRWHAFLGGGAS